MPFEVWESAIESFHESDPEPRSRMTAWSIAPGQSYFVAGDTLFFYDGTEASEQIGGITNVWVSPTGEVWAAGLEGVVRHRATPTSPWSEETVAPEHETLSGIFAAGAIGPVAVGTYGTLAVREGESWTTLRPADPCGFIRQHEMAGGEGWGLCASRSTVAHLSGGDTWEYPDLPFTVDDLFYAQSLAVSDGGIPTFVGLLYANGGGGDAEGVALHRSGGEWVMEVVEPGASEDVALLDVHLAGDMTGFAVGTGGPSGAPVGFFLELGGEQEPFFPETAYTGIDSIWGLDMERVVAADRAGNVWYRAGDVWNHELVCGDRSFREVAGDQEGNVFLLDANAEDSAVLIDRQIWD